MMDDEEQKGEKIDAGSRYHEIVSPADIRVDLASLGGLHAEIERLRKYIQGWFQLRGDEQWQNVIPEGRILLFGPLGTGKSTLLNAIAKTLKHPLIKIKSRAILGGNGENVTTNLKECLDEISSLSDHLLVFDPLEVFLKNDDNPAGCAVHDFLEMLENARLGEKNILLVGISNRSDILGAELLDFFDEVIKFSLPDADARLEILKCHLKSVPHEDAGLDELARSTEGWTGQDLERLIRRGVLELNAAEEQDKDSISSEFLLGLIRQGLVVPHARKLQPDFLATRKQKAPPDYMETKMLYPRAFKEQLYLQAASEDFEGVEKLIQKLDRGEILKEKDQLLLAKYAFILTDSTEERYSSLHAARNRIQNLRRLFSS
ncbi:MAG: AAA family ATPase [Candidatus Helarchaeales archaeon]